MAVCSPVTVAQLDEFSSRMRETGFYPELQQTEVVVIDNDGSTAKRSAIGVTVTGPQR